MSTEQRRKRIQALLSRRDRLGLTYEELSDECGIPTGTLASWQSKLKREADNAAFTELVVEDAPDDHEGCLEIIGPCGHRVVVTSMVDQKLLERVLSALPC